MYPNNVTELHPTQPEPATAFDAMFPGTLAALDDLTRDRKTEE